MNKLQILEGLDEKQRLAVTTDKLPLVILASAGSGKTTVLTKRVAYQHMEHNISVRHSLILTFTRKAALELKDRMFRLNIKSQAQIGTFHSVALSELTRLRRLQQRPDLKIIDNTKEILEEALAVVKIPYSTVRYIFENLAVFNASLHLFKVSSNNLNDLKALKKYNRTNLDSEALMKIIIAYDSLKSKRKLIEIDDIIPTLINHTKTNWKFVETLRFKYQHIFVDEFQDINYQQYEFLNFILNNRKSLCAVGDKNQSIYQFNGSNPELIHKLCSDQSTNVIYLTNNYRSNSQITKASINFLNNYSNNQLEINESKDSLADTIHIIQTADDIDELHTILAIIKSKYFEGVNLNEIAVLARTNYLVDSLKTFLISKNIPIHKTKPISNLKRYIDKNINSYQLNSPIKSLVIDISEAFEDIGTKDHDDQDRLQIEYLYKLINLAYSLDPEMTYKEFLEWTKVEAMNINSDDIGINLGTFHSAKGLEYKIVILMGIEDKLVPFTGYNGISNYLEEVNLFYVGITRAKLELFITWANNRLINSKLERRYISPFLKDFDVSLDRLESESTTEQIAHLKDILRSKQRLDHRESNLRPKVKLLNEWRIAQSKLSELEPNNILSDSELVILVKTRPNTLKAIKAYVRNQLTPVQLKEIKAILSETNSQKSKKSSSPKVIPLFPDKLYSDE
jgi:DNA helicase-2/ATP-dependent DNA helicase PcrA